MGKLDCPCGHTFSDTTESTWPVSYLITEKEMEKLCSAEQTEDTDVETRDVLVCPKCKRLAIQAKPDSVIYEFFESQAGREKDDG